MGNIMLFKMKTCCSWNRWPQKIWDKGIFQTLLTSIVCHAACYTPNREPISIHTQASAVINTCSGIREREDSYSYSYPPFVISILLTALTGRHFLPTCVCVSPPILHTPTHLDSNSHALSRAHHPHCIQGVEWLIADLHVRLCSCRKGLTGGISDGRCWATVQTLPVLAALAPKLNCRARFNGSFQHKDKVW